MIVHQFPQGSPAWLAARRGKITASTVEDWFAPEKRRLRTNKAGDGLSQGAQTFVCKLLAAWQGDESSEVIASPYMSRGNDMEAEAVRAYELDQCVDVLRCGFIESDCGMFGASLDGMVGDDGAIEIKIPGMPKQIEAVLFGTERAYAQIQFQLWVSGRRWCDRFLYSPAQGLFLPPERIERDEQYIADLADAAEKIKQLIAIAMASLIARGAPDPPAFDATQWDADGERIVTDSEFDAGIARIERLRAKGGATTLAENEAALETFR